MGSISGVISSLSSLAAKLLPGTSSSSTSDESPIIEPELKRLLRMLERIKVTLRDAEERVIRDRSVMLWLMELKEVAYAVEDVFDEYQYEVLRVEVETRNTSAENSHKRKKLELPDGMVDRIKETTNRFDEISNNLVALHRREDDGPQHRNDQMRLTITSVTSDTVEPAIFGRSSEKENLIDLLCSNSYNGDIVSVVAIVGFGGLGKTTVAQLVYNDPRMRQKFDLFCWIHVSSVDFTVERLTKEVVESITGNICGIKNLSALQAKLREEIVGKKVFLVLDDVWHENRSAWELFRFPFFSAKLVKILVTTRSGPVAQIMQTVPSFHLSYLTEEQCWQLFQRYAFGGVNCDEEWKLRIGKQIMVKCSGSPLALKVIASLLRHEKNVESWKEILESELWDLHGIYLILHISYIRLPAYLKSCLLYCSMFPMDYIYDVEELIQLWAAQGYIEPKGRRGIEEIGREYAKQLSDRSLFEDQRYNAENLLCEVKLHGLIHDMLQSNSQGECYSRFPEHSISRFPEHAYHVYVDAEVVKFFPCSSLRTLIVGNRVKNFLIDSDISEIQSLRAVKLKSEYHGTEFHNSFGNLKHLRFISLQSFSLRKLPEYVRDLYNVQTLILSECHDIMEFLNGIENLVSLRFLSLSNCLIQKLPESICYLKYLKVLRVISCPLVELPQQIGNLASLEELELEYCCVTAIPVSFCQLKTLRRLRIFASKTFNEMVVNRKQTFKP
ncbi:hypothetical protein LUZ60_009078 [Juncus effusus]|nr:hypothetical protein LUZ60_009078 [Juncus effusus]